VILDQAGYHKSASVQCLAKKQGIKLPYLPPYSPDLNPIERLWKVMSEHARKNRYFSSAQEFGEQLAEFFQLTLPELIPKLKTQINDNFQIINFAT
ncbi:MAG: transposase, partial [Cytophagales bacterium]|nr:transposase [Cytophagales bacterium]